VGECISNPASESSVAIGITIGIEKLRERDNHR